MHTRSRCVCNPPSPPLRDSLLPVSSRVGVEHHSEASSLTLHRVPLPLRRIPAAPVALPSPPRISLRAVPQTPETGFVPDRRLYIWFNLFEDPSFKVL